jgi:hypothetical protein
MRWQRKRAAILLLAATEAAGCGMRGTDATPDGSAPADAKQAALADSRADGRGVPDATRADVGTPRDAEGRDGPSHPADAPREASDASAPDAPDTCSDGVPVAYTRTSCAGTPAAVPMGLVTSLSSASLGDIVALDGLDDSSLPCFSVRVCVASEAPTLIFSDEPESPASDGVLYADALSAGAYRAYVYHTNAGAGLRKFPVVMLNPGTTTVRATITAVGIAGPSQDYVDVGKQAALRWYMSQGGTTTVDVPAGTRVLLDSDLDAVQASTNELAHAIIDFSIDGPVKLSVVSVEASEDATTVTAGLSLLPNTGQHVRGSFAGADLEIESIAPLDGAGARHLRLGGNVTDASLTGNDYVDNMSVTLDGNYGVAYALRLGFATGVGSAVVLSPQGGAWGGAGAVVTGPTPTPSVLPVSQDSLGTQTDAIVVGSFAGASSASLELLSAGGSSLPVDVVTLPLP